MSRLNTKNVGAPCLRRSMGAKGSLVVALCVAAALSNSAAGQENPAGIEGRVLALDTDGNLLGPIEGASIELKDAAGNVAASAVSGKLGYYRIALPPGTYYYTLHANGYRDEKSGRGLALHNTNGYASFTFVLVRGADDPLKKPAEIMPVEIGRVQGRVFEQKENGELIGIPGARVSLRRPPARNLVTVFAVGAEGPDEYVGRYEVTLETGRWQASASAEGYQTLVDPKPIEIARRTITPRDFILSRRDPADLPDSQGITGVVRLRPNESPDAVDQQVAPGIALEIMPLGGGQPSALSVEAGERFLQKLPAGAYRVAARAPGFRAAQNGRVDVFSSRLTDVQLILQAASLPDSQKPVLTVRVMGGTVERREPISEASVDVSRHSEIFVPLTSGQTDTGGDAELILPAPGDYLVSVEADGYSSSIVAATVARDGSSLVVTLERKSIEPQEMPAASIVLNLRVLEQLGGKERPVDAADLLIRKEGESIETASRAATDQHGKTVVSLESPGTYAILARKQGYEASGMRAEIRRGENERTVVLRRLAAAERPSQRPPAGPDSEPREITVSGYVVYKDPTSSTGYRGLRGATIRWSDMGEGPMGATIREVIAGAVGKYEIAMPEGDYRADVTPVPGFRGTSAEVPVRQGMEPRFFILERETSDRPPERENVTVRGYVVTRSANVPGGLAAVGGARVSWFRSRQSAPDGSGQSDSGGRFSVTLPTGSYLVLVEPPTGFRSAREEVQVRDGMPMPYLVVERIASDDEPAPNDTRPRPPQRPAATLAELTVQVLERRGPQSLPVADADVQLYLGSRVLRGRTVSAADTGQALFRVEPGDYLLSVSKNGYNATRRELSLSAGRVSETIYLERATERRPPSIAGEVKEFERPSLPLGQRSLSIQFTDKFSQRALAANLRIVDANGRAVVDTAANAQGVFSIRLDPGRYTVQALHSQGNLKYKLAQQQVTLADRDVTLSIALEPDIPTPK